MIGHRNLLLNCAAGWVARTVRGIRRQSGSEGGGGGAADGGGCGGGREAGWTETGRGVAADARRSRRGGRGGGQGGGSLGWFGLEVAEALRGGGESVIDGEVDGRGWRPGRRERDGRGGRGRRRPERAGGGEPAGGQRGGRGRVALPERGSFSSSIAERGESGGEEAEGVSHAGMPGGGAGHLGCVIGDDDAGELIFMEDGEDAEHVHIAVVDEGFAIVGTLPVTLRRWM